MIGIDTLRIRVRNPAIDPLVGLTFVPLATRYGIPLVNRVVGYEDLQAGGEGWAREIAMHQDRIHIESKSNYLMITIHLPQLMSLSDTRIRPLTLEEFWYLLDYVEEWCRDYAGIYFDILDAELSRLDIYANADSRFSYAEYKPLFELLHFKRQVSLEYPNSYYWFNSCRTTDIYNKKKQALLDEQGAFPVEENIIRWEIRLRHAKTIHRALKLKTVGDLVENWMIPIEFFQRQVTEALEMGIGFNQDAPITSMMQEIQQLMRRPHDTGALLAWIQAHGARSIQSRWRSVPDLREVLVNLGYNSNQAGKFIKRYRKYLTVRLSGDEVSINDLRNDLYTKLLE